MKLSEKELARRQRLRIKYFDYATKTGRFYIHHTSPKPFVKGKPERWGVRHAREKQVRKILVTGTGRCGTKFMAKRLQENGLDIQHEKCGKDGTSSHWFCVDSDWYPVFFDRGGYCTHIGERRDDFVFENIIWMVRNPLTCIPSIRSILRKHDTVFMFDNGVIPNEYRYADGEHNRTYEAMLYYFHVNNYIESSYQVRPNRIEFIKEEWQGIANRLDIPEAVLKSTRPVNASSGAFKKEPMTVQQLLDEDEILGYKIINMARRFGYEFRNSNTELQSS